MQDYPSVGQISEALDVSKKHVIFAVLRKVLGVYERLQKLVPRSSVNELKQDGDSNILAIVRDKYRVSQAGSRCHALACHVMTCVVSVRLVWHSSATSTA